jgi:hypothetical protein
MNDIVGKTVVVGCGRRGYLCFDYPEGGTALYEGDHAFECVVQKQWHDYECGWRLVGKLIGKQTRARVRALGFVPNNIYFGESNAVTEP